MNNAKITLDNVLNEEVPFDATPMLREKEGKLVKIIEALGRVAESEDWQMLEKEVFSGVVESLERRRKSEAEKPEINAPELYRLQGQTIWAKKFSDLKKLNQAFKVELANTRTQIKNNG